MKKSVTLRKSKIVKQLKFGKTPGIYSGLGIPASCQVLGIWSSLMYFRPKLLHCTLRYCETIYNESRHTFDVKDGYFTCASNIPSMAMKLLLHSTIGSYREIAIAIESEAGDSLT